MFLTLLLLLVIASWLYWLIACYLVHDFFRARPRPVSDFAPPVSILKPVRGLDPQAYQNFASFCRQDYPDFELVFGVADAADPVIPLIERLQRDFPDRSIRLIVTPVLGANRKASLLHQLASQARHEILVVSDSDMRVTPDYLRRVIAPLADAAIGLVTCPYRGESPLTLTARLESLHMGATFLPSVIVGRRVLAGRFAMGATIVLRQADLARLGGFAAVADYLADDFQLGVRIAAMGLKVYFADYIVASVLGATTFAEQWQREVRWARTNRVCRPREYLPMLVTFSTPLSLALVLLAGFAQLQMMALIISLLLRWVVAWSVSGCTNDREVRQWMIWLPVRDLLSAAVWLAGGVGQHIIWRGEKYRLLPGGRMEPAPEVPRWIGERHAW